MDSKAVKEYIVNWLKNYSNKAGTKGFVIGISGGVDSAVTSALCAETGLDLLVLEMPIHQHIAQVDRGRKHINFLKEKYSNVRSELVDLTAVYEQFVQSIPESKETEEKKLSLVNVRARLRMSILYYFAQLHSYLVAGTGNKVEDFGIGFFTKYGDGGVDLSPIGDLMKTEVYELGSELNIQKDILAAAPTDGLWGDDRTDEDQIGASYPELEWAMEFSGNEENLSERQKTVLGIYRRMHKANLHKMVPIPICDLSQFRSK